MQSDANIGASKLAVLSLPNSTGTAGFSLPARANRYRIVGLQFQFVTDATVANRTFKIVALLGGIVINLVGHGGPQVASATVWWSFYRGYGQNAPATAYGTSAFAMGGLGNGGFYVPPAATVNVMCINGVAGDVISNVSVLIEEFPETQ